MPKILTPRKAKWAAQFKPKAIKGAALNPNAAVAGRYSAALTKLVERMLTITAAEVEKFYEAKPAREFFAQDASVSAEADQLFAAMQGKVERLFDLPAEEMAENFLHAVDRSSAAALKTSVKELAGGITLKTDVLTSELKQVVKASVAENVALIKSIPQKYMGGVRQAVLRSITTGNGLADLVPYLEKQAGATKKRARLIANDQTRKAFNCINRGRMEKLGVKKFEWLHSGGGQHPRKLHQRMSGNIYSFDNLPVIDEKTGERGIPGQLINCRCRMIPVVSFDD